MYMTSLSGVGFKPKCKPFLLLKVLSFYAHFKKKYIAFAVPILFHNRATEEGIY